MKLLLKLSKTLFLQVKKLTQYFLINSLSGGGAERQVSFLINHLPIEKIICLFKQQDYQVNDNKKVFLWPKVYQSAFVRFLLIPAILLRLKKQIRPDKNTHIISLLQLSNIVGLCCKLIWKCKLTVSIRTTTSVYYETYKVGLFTKIFDKFIFKHADLLITNSNGSKQDLINNFKIDASKIVVITNGYDIEVIEKMKLMPFEEKNMTSLFTKFRVLLSVGRIDVEKGLQHTIPVFAGLKKMHPDIKYVILGQGPLKEELKTLAAGLDLRIFDADSDTESDIENTDLFFLGFRKNPYNFYHNAYLFLFPSLFEGMPNALAEAFLCGCMCIAADCKSGPREILTTRDINDDLHYPYFEFGYIMPVFSKNRQPDISAFRSLWEKQIDTLLSKNNKPSLTMPGYEAQKKLFSPEKILAEWHRVLG